MFDHTTTGVSSTDYVLYVSAGKTSGSTLAWATGCSRLNLGDDKLNRLVAGNANFGPQHLSTTDMAGQVATATHETMHAFGFSGTLLAKYAKTGETTLRGTSVTVVTSPVARDAYRNYIGCTTLEGPELENEGGSGSKGSHWDRRVLKDELLAASGGSKLSHHTLGALEDTGHFVIDYSTVDIMTFGKGAGCGFVTSKCDTVAGGKGKFWCFEISKGVCTVDTTAIGYCAVSTGNTYDPAFQYFSDPTKGGPLFFDGCPLVLPYGNRHCNDPDNSNSALEDQGNNFDATSMCLDTTKFAKSSLGVSSTTVASGPARCFKTKCTTKFLQFTLGKSSRVYACPKDGAEIGYLTDYDGSVTCPNHSIACSGANDTTEVITEDDGEVKGKLTFTGVNWGLVVLAHLQSLKEALGSDLAVLWGVSFTAVHLTEFETGDSEMTLTYRVRRGNSKPKDIKSILDKLEGEQLTNDTVAFKSTAAQYVVSNPSDIANFTGVTATFAYNLCGRLEVQGNRLVVNDSACYGVIALIVVVVLLLILCFVCCIYFCCCASDERNIIHKKKKKTLAPAPSSNDPYNEH